MDAKTKKLRQLMQAHKLTANDVADMLHRSPNTVRVWRCKNPQRIIPTDALRLLEIVLSKNAKVAA